MKTVRILSVLILCVLLLLSVFTLCSCAKSTYNNEVKSAYKELLNTIKSNVSIGSITGAFSPTTKKEIDSIRFYEPMAKPLPALINAFGTYEENNITQHYEILYDLPYEDYQAAKTAEKIGDYKSYIKILNEVSKNKFPLECYQSYANIDLDFNKEESQKFLEMFNLKEYGLNQVGFLPQFIRCVSDADEDYSHVTFYFKGWSFVKVDKGDGILPSNMANAVLSENLIKTK